MDSGTARARRLLVSLFIGAVIAGHAFEVISNGEHWPLSNYPMYSAVIHPKIQRRALVGVLADGREVPIEVNRELSPFDNTRLYWSLTSVLNRHGQLAYERALSWLYQRHESLRGHYEHDGPPLLALRAYELTWKIQKGAKNRLRPARQLLFEAKAAR